MKIFTYLILMMLFCACTNKHRILNDIKRLQSKKVLLPKCSSLLVEGKDTTILDYFECDTKLIIYNDSLGCTSCGINKLYLWDDLIQYASQFNKRLKFYFIFAPSSKDISDLKISLRNSFFKYPILLDTLGEFGKLNPNLPKSKTLHTFLLNENNDVILIGNPLYNKEIEKLFYKITQELLAK